MNTTSLEFLGWISINPRVVEDHISRIVSYTGNLVTHKGKVNVLWKVVFVLQCISYI